MTLRQGSVGDPVRQLQTALNGLSVPKPPLKTDGIYGPATTAAVIAFQRSARIPVDGVFGPRSAKALTYVTVAHGGKRQVLT